jgi:hypothetical protein
MFPPSPSPSPSRPRPAQVLGSTKKYSPAEAMQLTEKLRAKAAELNRAEAAAAVAAPPHRERVGRTIDTGCAEDRAAALAAEGCCGAGEVQVEEASSPAAPLPARRPFWTAQRCQLAIYAARKSAPQVSPASSSSSSSASSAASSSASWWSDGHPTGPAAAGGAGGSSRSNAAAGAGSSGSNAAAGAGGARQAVKSPRGRGGAAEKKGEGEAEGGGGKRLRGGGAK